jgi:ATP-dependent RNA helicase RhlE
LLVAGWLILLLNISLQYMSNFQDFPLSASMRRNLERNNFVQATPIQTLAIPPALEGRNVVATAQTGSGKTLAFVLPLIERLSAQTASKGVRAVILTPTRELAIQIEESFAKLAAGTQIRAAVVVGGVGEGPQLQAIRRGAQVVVATVGRLHDYLRRRLIDLSGVQVLVLDEADRMLDMGFLPSIELLLAEMPAKRQTLFFSATIESSVKHLVERFIPNAVRAEAGSTLRPAEHVDLHIYEIDHDRKQSLLEAMLRDEQGSFLVFARTKHSAGRLARRLSEQGVKSATIHGDRTQNQRNQALRGFQQGDYRVLVATDVAARGIHVDNIAHVVNFDLPQVPEDFIHRVGRTGRAGAHGTATTFATRSERGEITRIERTLSVRLQRKTLPELPPVVRSAKPVIELPVAPRREGQQRRSGPPQRRSFAPRPKARRAS